MDYRGRQPWVDYRAHRACYARPVVEQRTVVERGGYARGRDGRGHR